MGPIGGSLTGGEGGSPNGFLNLKKKAATLGKKKKCAAKKTRIQREEPQR